mmetsp:Transcript_58638/g.163618  ORF Transcript_58638/g.163618 Transcript_58638/m.163618 type:complete len:442 (-) Transcript_58638:165-1490(-)|eukprot:CAMPEP_0117475560 /NCGR_PEP_ID=MMETSP0784-20121206/9858_1 /TAXON_ID=39447 /ORGANISM="" /LENGTH=441 /DNA_ID=CAMNT_0005269811 /DNA_START=38 /DNA_END=1363 /DNA_ORIENTATION=+
MATAAVSNCVLLRLGKDGDSNSSSAALRVAMLRRQLEDFGEIAYVDKLVEQSESVLRVTYFDIRSAQGLREAHWEQSEYGPQEGNLSLTLREDALELIASTEVADVLPVGDNTHEVRFFDVRVASQVAAAAAAAQTAEAISSMFRSQAIHEVEAAADVAQQDSEDELGMREAPAKDAEAVDSEEPKTIASVLTGSAPAPAAVVRPCKVKDIRASELRWDDLAGRREWRTALQLRGLPRALCQRGQLEAFLHCHGLLEKVASVRILPSKGRLGCAVLKAKSVDDVQTIAKFFHGRQFGFSIPVAVSFACGQNWASPTSRRSEALKQRPFLGMPQRVEKEQVASKDAGAHRQPAGLDSKAAPRRVEFKTGEALRESSDASTASGSPRASDAPPEAHASLSRQELPVLEPPPGLDRYADSASSGSPRASDVSRDVVALATRCRQ